VPTPAGQVSGTWVPAVSVSFKGTPPFPYRFGNGRIPFIPTYAAESDKVRRFSGFFNPFPGIPKFSSLQKEKPVSDRTNDH
jgi:hypothetical protein